MTALPQEFPDVERLRWQCRRGLLELDYLLEAFLEQVYPHLDEQGRQSFVTLLRCHDPDLQAWLLGQQMPSDAALAAIVAQVRLVRP